MEIMSPASLWKDFDAASLPLDVTRLSPLQADGYRIDRLYFSALKVDDGCVRVFARLYTPLKTENAPVIIYFNDITKGIDEPSTLMATMSDYAFLRIDYAGRAEGRDRYTLFPKSLEKLNYFDYPEAIEEVTPDLKKSSRYVWAVMAMRAITLLSTEFPSLGSIGMVGVGLGGCPAIMASTRAGLSAAMTIYSAGYIPEDAERAAELTPFRAALDGESYGSYITTPTLVQITSNERDASMDYMSDVFKAMPQDKCRFSIVERSNRGIFGKQRRNCKFWFDYYARKKGSVPATPSLKASGSDGRLYIEVEVDKSSEVASIELFVSQGMQSSAYRNWSAKKLETVSQSGYIACVPISDIKGQVYSFVNVKYENGISLSSPQLVISPEKLSVRAEGIKPSRMIYDSDMGFDDWIVLNDSGEGDETKLSMQQGPFDIMGICSLTGSLSTFKLSEKIYESFSDSAILVQIYASEAEDVVFSVSIMHEGGFKEYSATRKLSPKDGWMSITLTATDFKSSGGTLESFQNLATFQINSRAKVLISSMLWV